MGGFTNEVDERRKLAKLRNAKTPIYEIAMRLKRAPSTIYREIKRNFYSDEEIPDHVRLLAHFRPIQIPSSEILGTALTVAHNCRKAYHPCDL